MKIFFLLELSSWMKAKTTNRCAFAHVYAVRKDPFTTPTGRVASIPTSRQGRHTLPADPLEAIKRFSYGAAW